MGRIRSTRVKRYAKEFLQKYGSKFNVDFENNKKVMSQVSETRSKKLHNVVAGYTVRLAKQDKYWIDCLI